MSIRRVLLFLDMSFRGNQALRGLQSINSTPVQKDYTKACSLSVFGSRYIQVLECLTQSTLMFFACFGDDEDVTCPYCQADLTVTSEESMVGQEAFQCDQCQGVFTINWDEGKIYYDQ